MRKSVKEIKKMRMSFTAIAANVFINTRNQYQTSLIKGSGLVGLGRM